VFYLCARTNDKQAEAYGENARRADKQPTKRIAVRELQILEFVSVQLQQFRGSGTHSGDAPAGR
jgi:hypothetical protein